MIPPRICTQAILPIYIFRRPFTFLDIGCSSPEQSCCYPLIELGCSGHFVDIAHFDGWGDLNYHQIDATKTDWNFVESCDFLQLDVEGVGKRYEVLQSIPIERLNPKIISVEHDGYRHHLEERIPQREYLIDRGYKILYKDIKNRMGDEYEDWWVSTELWNEYSNLYSERETDEDLHIKLNELWIESTSPLWVN